MPTALHPQAKFDPIPPDLDLHALVDNTPNLHWALRVPYHKITNLSQYDFEKVVLKHVIIGGKPLVIEQCNSKLPPELFSAEWFERTYNKKVENVRDLTAQTDIPMTTGHYLRSMKTLADQQTPTNFRSELRQRLYLKDIDCPPEWQKHLQKVLPPNLWYLNENVTSHDDISTTDDGFHTFKESTAAPAGDLMSSLPEHMRAQNLMCYVGHEGTYTPAHREMCASLGQNIMVEASVDGNGEKAGSSIWFMTETKDREVVREYWLSILGHDIEIERHFAQINAWKKATFPVYIVEQKVGDFILVPPLAPHQVWNRGTRTMKVAWNRTTAETLEMALHEALPKARLVCRDEQYKNKAIIYFTLAKYYKYMADAEEGVDVSVFGFGQELARSSPRIKQITEDFRALFALFTEILVDEIFAQKPKDIDYVEFDSNITCSYCRSNIFNRFLTCKHCIRTLPNGDEDTYDVCMECYAMGRSCFCVSNLQWCEQWKWSDLVDNYETWRAMVIKNDGFIDVDDSPQPLEIARLKSRKKSVAQICQEELKRRPFKDVSKPEDPAREETPEAEVDEDGKKKKKKNTRKKKKGDVVRCHVCFHKDYSYKLHKCTSPQCGEAYCYGVLYRAFDLMPQRVQEDERWQCPKCLGNCNCGACRRNRSTIPYIPKNTMLGHDTKRVADDRSVESIVDFRVHNLPWLKALGEEARNKDSKRMQALRQQADSAKAQDQEETQQAIDNAQQQTQTINGYGDQSHIFTHEDGEGGDRGDGDGDGGTAPGLADAFGQYAQNGTGQQPADAMPDMSLYPDPNQMPGMGYYEQDDTPDRILFDPYQMPSADMVCDPADEAEFVRQMQRHPLKRKSRNVDDDPEFRVSVKKRRKQKQDAITDILDNMDPALFDVGEAAAVTATAAAAEDQPVEQTAAAIPGPGHQGEEDVPMPDAPRPPSSSGPISAPPSAKSRSAPRFPANEPQLRHARPLASYTEPDEPVVDDPADFVMPKDGQPVYAGPLPVQAPTLDADGNIVTDLKLRRGGRKKKLAIHCNVAEQDANGVADKPETDHPSAGGFTPINTMTRLRTRPRKSFVGMDGDIEEPGRRRSSRRTRNSLNAHEHANSTSSPLDSGNEEEDDVDEDDPMLDDLETALSAELGAGSSGRASKADPVGDAMQLLSRSSRRQTDNGQSPQVEASGGGTLVQKRGRGRPRKSSISTPVRPVSIPVHTVSIPVHPASTPVHPASTPVHPTSTPVHPASTPVQKRGRGRPRKSAPAGMAAAEEVDEPARSPNRPTSEEPLDKPAKLMSMAERMAAKGKGFRIGKRKSLLRGDQTPNSGTRAPVSDGDGKLAAGQRSEADDDSDGPSANNHDKPKESAPSRSPSPQPSHSGNPTVVRLDDVSEPDDGGGSDDDNDDDADASAIGSQPHSDAENEAGSDDDDGDIPALGSNKRGRGTGRGRGVSRGRGGRGGIRGRGIQGRGIRGRGIRGRGRGRGRGRSRGR